MFVDFIGIPTVAQLNKACVASALNGKSTLRICHHNNSALQKALKAFAEAKGFDIFYDGDAYILYW